MASSRRHGTGTNQEAVRRHNLATLLGHVHRSGGVSRAQLTERMALNRSTIGDLVRQLDDLALVSQEVPEAGATSRAGVGRPSLDVIPDPQSVIVLAAELGVDMLEVARVGLGGSVLERLSRPTPLDHDPGALADLLVDMAQALLAAADPGSRLVGISVAVPGVVNDVDGVVRFAPNLGWSDVDFRASLAERLGGDARVRLGNDAELGALAEHIRGAGRSHSHLVYLSADVGVGGGVIVEGQPMRGASGYAGEVGHQRFDGGETRCRCGNLGCWETEIGSYAVADAVGCPQHQMHLLQEYLRPGMPVTPELRRLGQHLGVGLGGLVNVFNPEVIILGGVLRWVLPLVREEVHDALVTWALPAPAQEAEIVVPGLGGDSVIIGAAELAFGDLLADPVATLQRVERTPSLS